MKLQSLDDVFERRILRIPDYQRGYAWQAHQLEDFWEDLLQLDPSRIHYTGVITLEPVTESIWGRWTQDQWVIDGMGYRPFYVVDGQQRLTTSIILIQAILESIPQGTQLNYQSTDLIRSKFVLLEAEDKMRKSFLFGYEIDNPSDEFLKTKIFNIHSHSNQFQETLYTQNLKDAKAFFLMQLKKLSLEDIASLYKKLTQKLKFNLYEIDEEIDVFVTFETMNNRGRPLSSLELLKNRLIYLSTLFKEHTGHQLLRTKINDAWKTMYEYLGKNPEAPLSDNIFLRNHWTMYFKYSRKKGDDYIEFLLDERFTARNVTHPRVNEERVTVKEIEDYVTNLQQSIRPWFYIHNPYFNLSEYTDDTNKTLLNRMERLSFRAFKPLLLAAYTAKIDIEKINNLLVAAERYNFALFNLNQRRSNTGDTEFFGLARELLLGEVNIEFVITKIENLVIKYYDPEDFYNLIKEKYKIGRDGFYYWDGLRYFLFEYESWLKARGKQSIEKLSWKVLNEHKKDHVTVEHIFPQTPVDSYWVERYGNFTEEQIALLTHSLGNLLPLSRAKNSSLQNDSFPLKKNNGSGVGYYNGSVAENEISQNDDWLAIDILDRGINLLEFIETRWNLNLGDYQFKTKLLHLDFLENSEQGSLT